MLYEEQLDLLLEDEEMNKYSKEYYEFRMKNRDFKEKRVRLSVFLFFMSLQIAKALPTEYLK
ncbi:hypothetical protein BN990_01193 [Virgibacillus salexigens]|uniref:Uncharacterized protein n=1 Tax=Virgibacillus massiliensis TaxID=1462526 RepID=A0A024QAF0_9BACI|nr:hypothetical protein BN990_01193 [Virgibacillus massiliensis]